jgi:hypothetical protein
MSTRILIAASLLLMVVSAATESGAAEDAPRTRLQLSLGAVAGNNVLPAPLAPGVSVVVERRYWGLEGGLQIDPITLCERGGPDGACGLLLTMEAGGRASLPVSDHTVLYFSTRLQWLRMTEASSEEFGVALRPGIVFQGEQVGFFVEAGPTVLLRDIHEYPTIRRDGSRIVPMAMLGIRL